MAGLLNKHSTGAYTRETQDKELTSSNLDKIMEKDSDLKRRSRFEGNAIGNQRGLLNSSITSEAGVGALIDRATPIAQSDAQAYQQQGFMNQDAVNQAMMQGRDIGSREKMQERGFDFQGGENALDRTLQRDLQTGEFDWRSGENQLDRSFEQDMQESQFGFQRGESALDRGLTREQSELDRLLQQRLQSDDQSWRTSENQLDRALNTRLLELEQEFAGDQAGLDRALQTSLQESQQQFQSGETQLDREWRTQEAMSDREWQGYQADLDRTFQEAENQLDRNLQQGMAREEALNNMAIETMRQISGMNATLTDGIARINSTDLEPGDKTQLINSMTTLHLNNLNTTVALGSLEVVDGRVVDSEGNTASDLVSETQSENASNAQYPSYQGPEGYRRGYY